ncbi:unnamed protein product [Nippostrongylus brasiliensis]|uniref:Flap endonuclease GEN homolog 1 (inferred by orthology to a human protein) n=1 Tax=Nippostrongylus brasiliensis TaxID=27835 RepID=A0A0N4YDA8_NIPBR|nr:unnamed protein product [Nippostrongylus brasiliensis]
MGVTGIWEHMQKYAEQIPTSTLRNKTLAIDGHIWLYESSRGCANHFVSGASYLVTFFNRIQRLQEVGIRPVVVFDKIAPEFHSYSNSGNLYVKRSKRSGGNGWNLDAHNELKRRVYNAEQLLNSMGVPVVMGSSDGEAQCAQLEQAGLVDGCITSDFDFFLYGGRNLYKVDFKSGGREVETFANLFSMDKFESTQYLTRNRLVALALLLGCDYLQGGVNRVGIVTAREIISEFSINDDDHALTILDRFGEATSIYLCPEVKDKKELPTFPERNMAAVEQSHKLTEFFPTVRRPMSFSVSCDMFAQKHSRREWAALQRLRANAKLYDMIETADESKDCTKANGIRRRPQKRKLVDGSVSCTSSKYKRMNDSPNSGSSVQIIST